MTDSASRIRPHKAAGIAALLTERIEDGTYTARVPGINTLARDLGVNRKTVDRALRLLEREGLVVRRQGYGTFVAGKEPAAVSTPVRKNTRQYAFLLNPLAAYSGYLQLLKGLDRRIARIGGAVIFSRLPDDSDIKGLIGRLRSMKIEGIILCSAVGGEMLDALRREFNVVTVDYEIPALPANAVVWDNYSAGREVARQLHATGARDFAFLSFSCPDDPNRGWDNAFSNEGRRLAGAMDFLKSLDLEFLHINTDWDYGNLTPDGELADWLARAGANSALIITEYSALYPVLDRMSRLDARARLRIGSFGQDFDHVSIPSGVYAELEMGRLGTSAAELLLDIVGRPPAQMRREVLMPEIRLVE